MGKLERDSDDEMAMDIEPPRTNKSKIIIKKNRSEAPTRSSSVSTKSVSVIQKFAKSVNLKNKSKNLT